MVANWKFVVGKESSLMDFMFCLGFFAIYCVLFQSTLWMEDFIVVKVAVAIATSMGSLA